ncbi:MAG: class I SAM-dependent methyltransferase [Thermoguttaceae bacterium]|nr:class I SAM-dependent methyltransferase [Thermoguttaceae bacterium]MDW8039461.1 class I SAM-dependent methyltransferase [Thermoguttaceae bacterium]
MNFSAFEQIRTLQDWYYEFDLGGYKTPVAKPEWAIRHQMRRQYLMGPVLEVFGGTLAGRRVLDLGCNEGYFTLAALEAEAAFVLALDEHQEKLHRARLVLEALEIPTHRYELRCTDVETLRPADGPFDLVLLLGMLHWLPVRKALKLLETLAQMEPELLLVDTVLYPSEGAVLRLRREQLGPMDPYRDSRVCLLPSTAGLLELMGSFGYRGVVLRPQFADWTGSKDYQTGVRRGFLFARTLDLSRLSAPTESPLPAGQDITLQEASWKDLVKALSRKLLRKLFPHR